MQKFDPSPSNSHDWDARAAEALDQARAMPPGAKRSEALKKAGQLRTAADLMAALSSKSTNRPK